MDPWSGVVAEVSKGIESRVTLYPETFQDKGLARPGSLDPGPLDTRSNPQGTLKRLRRYLLEGLALVVPVAATVWVLWWLFTSLDGILGQALTPMVGRSVPGLGLVVLVLTLMSIGWLAERALGRRVTQLWESLVARVPVARPVYRASRRMLLSVLGQESRSFQRAVLCEYPTPGTWSIAFVTGDVPVELADEVGHEGVTVFLPTAPNPMSGFLLIVPPEKIRTLDVPVEAAFTFVVSMGAVAMHGETDSIQGTDGPSREMG